MSQSSIFNDIIVERNRQIEKWGTDNHNHDLTWLAAITEETGEVARALLQFAPDYFVRAELVQVAAVAVAWIEQIDRTGVVQHRP